MQHLICSFPSTPVPSFEVDPKEVGERFYAQQDNTAMVSQPVLATETEPWPCRDWVLSLCFVVVWRRSLSSQQAGLEESKYVFTGEMERKIAFNSRAFSVSEARGQKLKGGPYKDPQEKKQNNTHKGFQKHIWIGTLRAW